MGILNVAVPLSIQIEEVAVIARLDRATQYSRASAIDRESAAYWIPRFRGGRRGARVECGTDRAVISGGYDRARQDEKIRRGNAPADFFVLPCSIVSAANDSAICAALHSRAASSPAKAGDPVRRRLSVNR